LAWGAIRACAQRTQARLAVTADGDALYRRRESRRREETAANIGVEIYAGNARMVYIPGAAAVTAAMTTRMQRADVVFFRRYAVPRR
jgi:hypothetical protein